MLIEPDSNTALAALLAHKRVTKLMGNMFEITAVSDDTVYANACIDAAIEEISRIEKLLTTFNENSQTALIKAKVVFPDVIVGFRLHLEIADCRPSPNLCQIF